MKKTGIFLMSMLAALGLVACSQQKTGSETAVQEEKKVSEAAATETKESAQEVYPDGTITIYGTGQPQYLKQYFDKWLEDHKDIAPGVTIEIVQNESQAKSREKITMTALSGATEDLPDAVYIDPVNILDLASADLLSEETEFVKPLIDKMVDGATNDATIDGKIYGLPESVRPNVLFYNKDIFDKYGLDPDKMKTFEGYYEVGKELKEKSGGKVFLSYISPNSLTWRYYGRRGLMPQSNARIWDENGEIAFGNNEGTKQALTYLAKLNDDGLLLKSEIMQPALYDAINNQEIATFYIGAFWDEFLRKNCQATAGQWRVMASPVFENVGTAGAPVSSYFCIINKENSKYKGLLEKMWYSFHFDIPSRVEWVKSMEEQNAPYANPISKEMLEDEFWKEPSEFYGGQSFREMEGKCLENSSKNMTVTPQDAEADEIISAEIETYIAGDQSMEKAIENINNNLKAKIGKAEIK